MVIRPSSADSLYPPGIEGPSVVDKISERVFLVLIVLFLAMGVLAMGHPVPSGTLIDYPAINTRNIAYDPGSKIRPPPYLCDRQGSPKYEEGENLSVDYVSLKLCNELRI